MTIKDWYSLSLYEQCAYYVDYSQGPIRMLPNGQYSTPPLTLTQLYADNRATTGSLLFSGYADGGRKCVFEIYPDSNWHLTTRFYEVNN